MLHLGKQESVIASPVDGELNIFEMCKLCHPCREFGAFPFCCGFTVFCNQQVSKGKDGNAGNVKGRWVGPGIWSGSCSAACNIIIEQNKQKNRLCF